jgi:protein ImuB
MTQSLNDPMPQCPGEPMLFAAIYVPDFPVEAILRAELALRDEAVAVMEGTPPLLRVIACNGKASQAGVEVGMTRMQVGACLPESGIRLRSAGLEASAHAALLDCACAFSPRVEDAAAEAVVLDLAGLERIFGPPAKIACDLVRRCSEMGLEANVAVASNPDAALLAARGFAGVTVIPPGEEGERLGGLPVDVLPGVGSAGVESSAAKKSRTRIRQREHVRLEQILETLDRWGVRNLRALAALPEVAITERLGQEGLRWQRLAQGAVSRPLVPVEPPLEFEEVAELEYPVELLEPLAFVLNRMLEQLCARLEARALSTHELRLRLELEGSGESAIHERTLHVPVPMRDAKVFLKLLQLDLKRSPPAAPVLKIWLRAEPVRPRVTQGGLFLPAVPPPEKLELTLARIAAVLHPPRRRGDTEEDTSDFRFLKSDLIQKEESASGNRTSANQRSAIRNQQWLGSPELLDTHRPGAFRIRRFVPPDAVGLSKDGAVAGQGTYGPPKAAPITALRILRPSVPVGVEVREGRPVRLVCNDRAAFSGEVVWSTGPWRSSGEWWAGDGSGLGQPDIPVPPPGVESGWSQEDWDLAVQNGEGIVVCRVCRNTETGRWTVDGIYD